MNSFPTIWKGNNFTLTRLLLLGESAYSWIEGEDEVHPSDRHACDLAEWEIEESGKIGFTTLISRALSGLESPTRQQRQMAWDRIAFANFVPVPVGSGSRLRPTEDMWALGKDHFRHLLAVLAPRRIVVLGKDLWSHMPECDRTIAADIQGYRLATGELCMCRAVNHPSAGLSWRSLAEIVHFAYAEAFEDIRTDNPS